MHDLGIIILNYNTKDITADCLASIQKSKNKLKYKVLVIDNGSGDGSYSYLKDKFPEFTVKRSEENLGFTRGNNVGIKYFKGKAKYVLLLNSDTLVFDYTFDKLVNFAKNNDFDIAACKFLNKDGSFQASGGAYPSFLAVFAWLSGLDDIFAKVFTLPSYQQRSEEYFKGNKQVGWVGGACMLVKAEVFDDIGGLDEKIFMYGEEVEFCVRAQKKGYRIGWSDKTKIIHIGGASLDKVHERQWLGEFKSMIYIYNKHYGAIPAAILKFLIYVFISIRIVAFILVGRKEVAKVYAKIITKI